MISIPQPQFFLVGALAFLRIGGIVFALPVFGDSPTPVRTRAFLALALTFAIYPLIPRGWAPNLEEDVLIIGNYVLRELTIGLAVGFVARLAFDGLLMAASVVSFQMGFGAANLFMPDFGSQMDSFTAFHRLLIMLIFLSLGLHHIFISAILDTFKLIPGGSAEISGPVVEAILSITAAIFTIALQLAAPILVALLFTMAALGLIARTVPQMNVFTMSFPASFTIGLLVYGATLALFPPWMEGHFMETREHIFAVIRGMAR